MATVSVCMLVYNHELYINEAIEGVWKQKTNFDIELVISNDASTDNSHKKILAATQNLPVNITLKYFNHKDNLGMIGNVEFSLKQCTGKYMAMCEGDDYWIDPFKLQRQVDFLDANPQYNLITGNVRQYIQNTNSFIEPTKSVDFTFDYKDMIVKNQCSTCTTLIRNFILREPNFKLIADRGSDSQLWLRALGKKGKGKFLAHTFAVYRRHDTSSTGIRNARADSFEKSDAFMQRKIAKAEFWNNYFGNEAKKSVLLVKLNIYKKMIKMGFNSRKYFYCIATFLKLIKVKTELLVYGY